MQSRLGSLVESFFNIGSGFLLAMVVWQWIVAPLYNIPVTLSQNVGITSIFTVVSVIRSYAWRRAFNYITHRNLHKNKKNQEKQHVEVQDRAARGTGNR